MKKQSTFNVWLGGVTTAAIAAVAAAPVLVGAMADAAAETKKRRIGPPPKVYTALPNQCSRCHKEDGRGGPAYGGFAADLRATGLDKEGLIYICLLYTSDAADE